MRIPIPSRRSPVQRLLDKVIHPLEQTSAIKTSLPSMGPNNARKAGLIAGAVAGITAGSAGISSLRRRTEGARDNS
ncbi:MAG: hypothetical protein M3065_02055 [Actinomycetota bacterium]|nr:hypothetical protein [Actinomycetota bacterium]